MNTDSEIKRILFSGIDKIIIKEIEYSFDNYQIIYESCNFEEADDIISKFLPDIIITSISMPLINYKEGVVHLKQISESFNLPLAVVVNGSDEDLYIFLIKNEIDNIITIPIDKKSFIKYIESFINKNNIEIEDGYTKSEHALASNLIVQNRLLKYNIKNKASKNSVKPNYIIDKEKITIEENLWDSLASGYFRLYYQPVIDLKTEKLSGFEALIRIDHPEQGLIPPDKFIAIAEDSAIIFPLGFWIIEESCRQIKAWKKSFVVDSPLKITINLSARQFIHPGLIEHIFNIADKFDVDSDDIAFELTESAFMDDMKSANIALLELRSRKFSIYMDDFGTGYSSLTYLMHFPVNVIKIDQSFVKWMHIDEQSEKLVKSIITLAHNLDLKIVAEGTEDKSQIEILKSCNCDYAQGYYYSKPLPAEEAMKFIHSFYHEKG